MKKDRHSIKNMPPSSHEGKIYLGSSKQSGQSLIEFLFLMLILIGLSFGMLSSFNYGVSERWRALVTLIAEPTPSAVEF